MINRYISHIAAETEVFPDGQRCVRAIVEYDRPIDPQSVDLSSFEVSERTLTGIEVAENKVVIHLNPEDAAAATYHPGNPWLKSLPVLTKASVTVRQKSTLSGIDGTVIEGGEESVSDQVKNLLVDEFVQGEFEGLKYNLFIPRDYDETKRYPIVQFIHDAGPCGPDSQLTLAQGIGALVWMTPEEQRKNPCFVLAPQFDVPSIVDDDWNVDARLETAKRLLDKTVADYNIDRDRIYTTGQSMGCMSSIVLNIRYPDYFAASLLVAGQWNDREIEGLERQHLWMINSQGDAKAFPVMNQMCCQMEKRGAKIVRRVWENGLSQREYEKMAQELIATGANIIYTPYLLETVADGWHSNGGEHHVATWKNAYSIEAVRSWLFTNHR